MAKRVAVMQAGKIAQVGAPEHIYSQPATRFVAHFIGDTNILSSTVRERRGDGTALLESQGLRFVAATDAAPGESRHVSLRPEKIRIATARPDGHAGRISEVTFLGPLTRYEVTVGDGLRLLVQAQTESDEHFRKDDRVGPAQRDAVVLAQVL